MLNDNIVKSYYCAVEFCENSVWTTVYDPISYDWLSKVDEHIEIPVNNNLFRFAKTLSVESKILKNSKFAPAISINFGKLNY